MDNNTINTNMIDRDTFNNMSIPDQINYINNLLETGETLNNICNNMPIAKKTLRNRFKKMGYIFNKKLRQYTEEASESQIKGQINIIDVLENNSEHPKHPEGANKPEEQSLKDVYLRLEQMQREINLIKQNNNNNINNSITAVNTNNLSNTINTRLEQLREGGESVSRVYRVNPEIQKEFKSLCKKHLGDGINISDIVSLCMLEFIEKYK